MIEGGLALRLYEYFNSCVTSQLHSWRPAPVACAADLIECQRGRQGRGTRRSAAEERRLVAHVDIAM
jgi:hypothetical protein